MKINTRLTIKSVAKLFVEKPWVDTSGLLNRKAYLVIRSTKVPTILGFVFTIKVVFLGVVIYLERLSVLSVRVHNGMLDLCCSDGTNLSKQIPYSVRAGSTYSHALNLTNYQQQGGVWVWS